ncbi:hypothetical protein [Bradyrhizobium sp. URHD0069]|uniref:hypothetical protein n=1 Tax=Bradyrhizobium sp. URHD0069 TaxID=1380355 RepID=UPI000497531A|nr:hypothetical protein [Bradyrhizobium sp. URHD0069]
MIKIKSNTCWRSDKAVPGKGHHAEVFKTGLLHGRADRSHAATSSDAEVLRNKSNAPTVWFFKDADALRRFGKVVKDAVYDNAVATTPLACKARRQQHRHPRQRLQNGVCPGR